MTVLTAQRSPWRFAVAAAALAAAAVHVPVIAPHLDEAPYMGTLFILLAVACVAIAAALLVRDARPVYALAALTCGLAIVGYAATRMVAFPELADDVGNWLEPLGVAALASEAVVVMGSLLALAPASVRLGRVELALVGGTAAAALVLAGGVGYVANTGESVPSATSVDAGFARDMSTHHRQAITMASYTRDHTGDPDIKLLATDIETGQYFQLGEMQGWLDDWGVARDNSIPPMAWMSSDSMDSMDGMSHDSAPMPAVQSNGLMPGMATPQQMNELETLTGGQLDVFFLQLMLRHHEGGLSMAQYAAAHAQEPYVRDVASKIYANQGAEITEIKQLLAARGAAPLSS